jgi:hypothetical protein
MFFLILLFFTKKSKGTRKLIYVFTGYWLIYKYKMYFKLIYKTDEEDNLDCIVKFDNKYHKKKYPLFEIITINSCSGYNLNSYHIKKKVTTYTVNGFMILYNIKRKNCNIKYIKRFSII